MRKWIQVVSLLGFLWLSVQVTGQVSANSVKQLGEAISASLSSYKTGFEEVLKAAKSAPKPVVYEPNYYEVGQCTWGAKELAPWAGTYWGNGGDWADSALAAGFEVGSTAKVGAIMVWSDGGYGHVAVVSEVGADGRIQVMEANYGGHSDIGNYRGWFNPADEEAYANISYIYPKV